MKGRNTSNVFAETVFPILRAAKELGATSESVITAFLAAMDQIYGRAVWKQLSPWVGATSRGRRQGSPKWDARERGRKMMMALKKAEGGAGTWDYAAARLSLSLPELHDRVTAVPRKVVTWLDGRGRFRYPRWQFGKYGMLPGVEECLAELVDSSDDWAVMRFFLTPAVSGEDQTPLDLLRMGKIGDAITFARQAGRE